MDCLILMATYNGTRYIQQQIDSIISQSFKNWRLIIRDDGSNDNTVEIIKKYVAQDLRISLISNKTDKHGAFLNFWSLINEAKKTRPYDYYFFSDQDDVWLPDKIQGMLDVARNSPYSGDPMYLYSDMELIDGWGNTTVKSLNSEMGIELKNANSLFFTHGFLWGCAGVVNRKLLMSEPLIPLDSSEIDIISHDNYAGKFALTTGHIVYINKCYMKYRRYDANVTGMSVKIGFKTLIKKSLLGYQNLARTHARVYDQTLYFIENMENAGMATTSLELYAKIINEGGVKAAFELYKLKVKRKQLSRTFGIYIVMMLGSYKKYMVHFKKKR